MVAPCIPCLAAMSNPVTAPIVLPAAAAATGYYMYKRSKKKKNSKKKKKSKKIPNKKKSVTNQSGGSLKKDMRQITDEYWSCNRKCSNDILKVKLKRRRFTRSKQSGEKPKKFNRFEGLSPEQKKQWNKEWSKRKKCVKNCGKIKTGKIKKHKKQYSKEYRAINKENANNCCRCAYIKKNGKLFKIRGDWNHCSYNMDNCCKDKKTIVKKSKKR
jgi:hypothetical protein